MDNNNSMQNLNGPQNFSNQTYNPPPQQYNNKPPKSGLGIAALILSILGCTFVIAIVLAIIDLNKKDGKSKTLSIVALVISGLWLLVGIFGGAGNKNKNNKTSTTTSTEVVTELTTEEVTEEASEEDIADDKSVLQDRLKDDMSLVWFGDVRNDATGNWRYSMYSESDSQETFALEYYKAFFESDDEIHAVINTTNKTTAKISVVGTKLDVTIHEYLEDEEHDANKLFGGDVLKQYLVSIDDGSVEDVVEEQNSEEANSIDKLKVYVNEESAKYGLKMDIVGNGNDISGYIVEIYGYDGDFDKMKSSYIEIIQYIDSSVSEDILSTYFDDNIGKENNIKEEPNIGKINYINFSAPNDIEEFYRIDISTLIYNWNLCNDI